MKNKRNPIKLMSLAILLFGGMLIMSLSGCSSKNDTVTPSNGTVPQLLNGPIPNCDGSNALDTGYTIDQVHSGMCWYVPFQNVANTNLTGKFSTFNFSHGNVAYPYGGMPASMSPNPGPKSGYTAFWFDPNNLQNCYMNFWLEMSTFNTGQPGRDGVHLKNGLTPIYQPGYGGTCGPGYVGQCYVDSTKDTVFLPFDTARFISSSFTQSGTGYIVQGTFYFNHYRPGTMNGTTNTDGEIIGQPMTIYLQYNGENNIPSTTVPGAGEYWVGFTGTTTVSLPLYVDQSNTGSFTPVPGELAGSGPQCVIHDVSYKVNNNGSSSTNTTAAGNLTYGSVSTEVANQVQVTINCIFYQKYPR